MTWPTHCPGPSDPRCVGNCTVDRDGNIKDPDCFRDTAFLDGKVIGVDMERGVANPNDFPTSWFIGDSVLSRYSLDKHVRILPHVPEPGVHHYRVVLKARHSPEVFREEFRVDLGKALTLGEEWIP